MEMMVAKGTFPTTEAQEASGPVTNLGVVGKTTRSKALDKKKKKAKAKNSKKHDDKDDAKEDDNDDDDDDDDDDGKEPPAKRARTN